MAAKERRNKEIIGAIRNRDSSRLKSQLNSPGVDLNLHSSQNWSSIPLLIAADKNRFDDIKILLNAGADVNIANNFGYTALHLSAWRDYVDVLTSLLSRGADANARNMAGETPLHWACRSGRIGCARVLIDSGCRLDVVDWRGRTARDRAFDCDWMEIVELLDGVGIKDGNNSGGGSLSVQELWSTSAVRKNEDILEDEQDHEHGRNGEQFTPHNPQQVEYSSDHEANGRSPQEIPSPGKSVADEPCSRGIRERRVTTSPSCINIKPSTDLVGGTRTARKTPNIEPVIPNEESPNSNLCQFKSRSKKTLLPTPLLPPLSESQGQQKPERPVRKSRFTLFSRRRSRNAVNSSALSMFQMPQASLSPQMLPPEPVLFAQWQQMSEAQKSQSLENLSAKKLPFERKGRGNCPRATEMDKNERDSAAVPLSSAVEENKVDVDQRVYHVTGLSEEEEFNMAVKNSLGSSEFNADFRLKLRTANQISSSIVGECGVCLESERDCLLYPCKHLCLCHSCASVLTKPPGGSGRCPICRTIIERVEKIYLS